MSEDQNKQHKKIAGNANVLWWSAVQPCCSNGVTYLHSPFPLEVASHLPPFRHDSVGREHFRPVEHMKMIKTHLSLYMDPHCMPHM